MKKIISILCVIAVMTALAACGGQSASSAPAEGAAAEAAAGSAAEGSETSAAESSALAETQAAETQGFEPAPIADGIYTAEFNTDSGMFHVNEANDGKGILTVKDGVMTIHVALVSKNIVNLFLGVTDDAKKDGAVLLQPVAEKVTYSDGYEEEVYAFDIPVPYLDKEYDLALIGTKGKWYDHKVSVTNPVPAE